MFFVYLGSKNDLDAAIVIINKALSEGVELSHLNSSALHSLEDECKKAGKSFPFSIPKVVTRGVTFKFLGLH